MLRVIVCLLFCAAFSGCITIPGTVERSDWLDCCRICVDPKNVENVYVNMITGDATCKCIDGESVSLVRE
jgi:hypothetical protein